MFWWFHVPMDSGALEVILLRDRFIRLSLKNIVRDNEVEVTCIHLELVSTIDLREQRAEM
jgi:hypothetical protein